MKNPKLSSKPSPEQVERALPNHEDGVERVDSALLDSTEGFEGRVSETARASASENQGVKTQGKAQTQIKDLKTDLSDRSALRERLLKAAPQEPQMRSQIREVLKKKKVKLESTVKKYSRKRNYPLMERTIMELRRVVHQLEELAQMTYERMKEFWLKVVHRLG